MVKGFTTMDDLRIGKDRVASQKWAHASPGC
jgi:hypothetical protein